MRVRPSTWRPVVLLVEKLKQVKLPGFDGLSVYDIALFFFQGLNNASVDIRASSLAFRFFMAIFPSLIFLFTLIPYIPISGFQQQLLLLLGEILPKSVFSEAESAIVNLISQRQGGLLSFGFFFTLYLTTNGMRAMINSFNETSHFQEKRNQITIWLISLVLVFILFLLLAFGISLIVFGNFLWIWMAKQGIISAGLLSVALVTGKWVSLLTVFFVGLSLIYYLGPGERSPLRFTSAGASFATLLIIMGSLGFAFFVNNFGNYNKFYGSLGTIIVVMLWIYFNTLAVLLGYELNNSLVGLKGGKLPERKEKQNT